MSALEAGIKALGADFQEGLLNNVDHPIAGLCAGVLATVLVQSSSVSTSTIVGLVGAGTLGVDNAVPMIMGANLGTTVTNTLASLGSARRTEEFKRALAGATMHDFFNLMCVAVFLPLQIATGFISKAAEELANVFGGNVRGGETDSPIKEYVKEPVNQIKEALDGPLGSGDALGVALIILGLLFIFMALAFISQNMRRVIAGRVESAMNNLVAGAGGTVGIFVGLIITVAVQSSSITTSILVPMVGSGVLTIRNALPITMGANLGTTVTALFASLAVDFRAGLVIALTHTLFNLFGILLFFPVRAIRNFPVTIAERFANLATDNRTIVALYVFGVFIGLPLAGVAIFR